MNLHEAIILRDKHRLRTPEETIALYEFINTAATNHEYTAVFNILHPFMLNVAKDVKKRYALFNMDDMVQDTFIVLSDFVDRYDSNILPFIPYITAHFNYTFNHYCYMKYRYLYREFSAHFENYIDKRAGTEDYMLGVIFAKNILKEFYKAPSCKGITSSKRFEVYNKILSHYFVDNLAVKDIAAIMKSSYFSVYEKIARYLYYLSTVLNKDEFRTLDLYSEVRHGGCKRIMYSKVYEYRSL